MPTTFEENIKPYFTPCYRAHMIDAVGFDLWSSGDVQGHWQAIHDRVSLPAGNPQRMPRAGCPEGVWDDLTRNQFLQDFDAWRAAGYP